MMKTKTSLDRLELHWLIWICCLVICQLCVSVASAETVESPIHRHMTPQTTDSTCQEMLNSFAFISANFTYCTIQHSRPIKLCEACVATYFEVKEVYNSILNIEDMGGGVCYDQLVNLDRLQVVNSGFDYVDKLWDRASCNSCYVFDSGKPELSPTVTMMLNISGSLDSCISEHRNASVHPDLGTCTACEQHYTKLNTLYNSIKASTGDINYCMDIIDLMNTTRGNWSGIIGCCNDRKKPELKFLGMSSGVIFATFLFYVAVYVFTQKGEQPILPQKRWTEKFTSKRSSLSTVGAS